jgi:hypothetical protein
MNRLTVIPLLLWALVAACFLYAVKAHAEPILQASQGGVTITLHSEDCKITELVANLPKRATWQEQGKTFEGCFGAVPQMGLVMLYFKEDKSVAGVPIDAFKRVVGV